MSDLTVGVVGEGPQSGVCSSVGTNSDIIVTAGAAGLREPWHWKANFADYALPLRSRFLQKSTPQSFLTNH